MAEVLAHWDAVIRLLLVNRTAPAANLKPAMKQLNKLLQDIKASEVSQDTWRLMIEQQVPYKLSAVCSMAYSRIGPRDLCVMFMDAMTQLLSTAHHRCPEPPSSPNPAADQASRLIQSFWQQLQGANFFNLLADCMECTAQQLQSELEAAGKYTGLTHAITPGSSSSGTGSVRSWVYEYGEILDTFLTISWLELLLGVLLKLCTLQQSYLGTLSESQQALCTTATASAAADLVLAAMQYACSTADPESKALNQPGPCANPEAWQPLVCSAADVCKLLTDPVSVYARTCSPVLLQSSSYTACKVLALLLAFPRTASCAGSSSSSSGAAAAAAAPAQESGGSSSSSSLSFQPVGAAEPGALPDAAAAYSLLQARQEGPDTFPVAYLRLCELLACDPKALWAIGSYAQLAAPMLQTSCADELVQDWLCAFVNTTAAAEAVGSGRAHFGAMSELHLLRQMQLYAWTPSLLLYWLEQRAQRYSTSTDYAKACTAAVAGCDVALRTWRKLAVQLQQHRAQYNRTGGYQYARGSGCDGMLPFAMLKDMLPLLMAGLGRLQKLDSTAAAAAAAAGAASAGAVSTVTGQPIAGAASSAASMGSSSYTAADCMHAGADLHSLRARLLVLVQHLADATMWDDTDSTWQTTSSSGSSGRTGLAACSPDVQLSRDQFSDAGPAPAPSGMQQLSSEEDILQFAPQWEAHLLGLCRMAEGFVRQTALKTPADPPALTKAGCVVPLVVSGYSEQDVRRWQPGLLLVLADQAGAGSQEQLHFLSLVCSLVKLSSSCQLAAHAASSALGQGLAVDAACGRALGLYVSGLLMAGAAFDGVGSAVDMLPSIVLMGRSCLLHSAELQQQLDAVHASGSVATVLSLLDQRLNQDQMKAAAASAGAATLRLASELAGTAGDLDVALTLLSAHSAELESAGYDVLTLVSTHAAYSATYALLSSCDSTESGAAALADLLQQLHAAGLALCSLAVPVFCNNPTCSSVSGPTELGSVAGRSKLCADCLVARYCSRECQRVHWKQRVFGHKQACKQLVAAHKQQAAAKQ